MNNLPVRSLASDLPDVRTLGLARLTAGMGVAYRLDWTTHLSVHGPLPDLGLSHLTALAEEIGLCGRGGAGFPFARKLRAVATSSRARRSTAAVVVNGCEGEPACRKDTVLLARAPHLVLDGALLAAEALGAEQLVVGVTRAPLEESVRRAMAERGLSERRGRRLRARVFRMPERFVSGEATALLRAAGGGPALPPGRRVRSAERGLSGLPTLVSNAETFAQLAVAARMGAGTYASTGTREEPGTVLLTLGGCVPRRTVLETPTGVPLAHILERCGSGTGQGVLVGGYHGTWLDPDSASMAAVSRASMAAHRATLGAGAVLPLSWDVCPLGETLRVAQWLAAETAGQCGPCRLGLPALAGALADVLGGGGRAALDTLRQYAGSVRGRGACKHPDGSARFVLSSVNTFTDDLAAHVLGNGCGRPVAGVLPLPDEAGPTGGERLAVDWTLCAGHGLCADLLPEAIRLDRDGYPVLSDAPLPEYLRPRARRALARCPALALRLENS
ncbi:ferredoxin [Streptomyces sp. RB6PN25]|uniref:Ferredoxin n=1 Tax=Streptomyces humicola TaxID=2953240 RepID=A0ABT1PXG2_9ACTN|nr:NADH-quinone oxidoreductase subunit NuoF family protein [Streptomyces humicola]MCQ4082368.1 ferredoxin [Streptomyces humicola]